jgi:hypothetical protein
MNKFLFIILLFSIQTIFAQQQLSVDNNSVRLLNFTNQEAKALKIEGSVYVDDIYKKASVSTLKVDLEARYNALEDEIEVKYDNTVGQIIKLDSLTVKFVGTNKTYQYVPYTYQNESVYGFLVLKTNNKQINFYTKESVKYIPFQEGAISYGQKGEGKPAYYKREKEIYFIGLKGRIIEMPLKKKELLELFSDNKTKIEDFTKKNKTNFKEEADLISLINYLNTL